MKINEATKYNSMSLIQAVNIKTIHGGPIDLRVAPGDCLGLTGPSGSGKSLLLRALADLDPHGGTVLLNSQAQKSIPGAVWRSRVGYLPSESHWWALTVKEHFPKQPPWLEKRVKELNLPTDCLDWSTDRLSSGEKQRLAFLRMLSLEPEVLLLDEPTANLDNASMRALETMVVNHRRHHQAAVIWVSHDRVQLQRVAEHILELNDIVAP